MKVHTHHCMLAIVRGTTWASITAFHLVLSHGLLLFVTIFTGLTGPGAARNSPSSTSHFSLGALELRICTSVVWFSMGLRDLNPGSMLVQQALYWLSHFPSPCLICVWQGDEQPLTLHTTVAILILTYRGHVSCMILEHINRKKTDTHCSKWPNTKYRG